MRLFADDSSSISDPYLRRAYELALRGLGTTSPNPMVGCVVVSDGSIVGEGWHERAGGEHAEARALVAAGEKARGATVYVTLEPCAHHGRTPPCTEALISQGVARVVIGAPDPSAVAGGGADRLRDGGVEVKFAPDRAPFDELNNGWLSVVRSGRPWVTVKLGMTLDGKIAALPGVRTAVTSEGSRAVTMSLRKRADAVVIGGTTARIDDPALTARDHTGTDVPRQPVRVLLTAGGLPVRASFLTDGRGPTALLLPEASGVDSPHDVPLITYEAGGGLASALRALAAHGFSEVLIESGPRLFSSLWDDDLIDELVTIQAGRVFGAIAPGFYEMNDAEGQLVEPRFTAVECAVAGGDAVTVWRRMLDRTVSPRETES